MSEADPTVSSVFVRAALDIAERKGEDVATILPSLGIPASVLAEPDGRVGFDQYARLIDHLWRSLDDELLGYGRRPFRYGTFAMLAHAVIRSSSLERALRNLSRYYGLLQDGRPHFRIEREHDQARFVLDDAAARDPGHFLGSMILVICYRICCWLIGSTIRVDRTLLKFPEHEYRFMQRAFYANSVYAGPLRYEAAQTALCFSAKYLDMPIVQDEASLRAFLRDTSRTLLRPDDGAKTLGTQIRRLLGQDDQGLALRLGSAARELSISPQTLRRRLQSEGTTFMAIKHDWRRGLAMRLLAETSMPIADIARRTGFTESSAFHRAFKKWTGMQPNAYRASLAQRAAETAHAVTESLEPSA